MIEDFGGNIFPVLCETEPVLAYLSSIGAEVRVSEPTEVPDLVMVFRPSREEGKPQPHPVAQGRRC